MLYLHDLKDRVTNERRARYARDAVVRQNPVAEARKRKSVKFLFVRVSRKFELARSV